uniref:Uncharacterized protein n=1 Tax=Caenorhabditis japonica TaxID=281687 RepID=A0A8R1I2M0_CAEJA
RPSGATRFFRAVFTSNNDYTSWRIERAPVHYNASNTDIQVICRRYNGQKFSSAVGFVRKIFLLKVLPNCPPEVSNQLINRNLAIISYSYRNAAVPTFIEQPGRALPTRELIGEEVEVVSGDVVFDEDIGADVREMVESVERKKKANGQRL